MEGNGAKKDAAPIERLAYSVPEFCKRANIGRTRAYEEIKAGRLKVLKCGRRSLITPQNEKEWLRRLDTLGAEGA